MRYHVLSLPHTITNKDYLSCAYTQKVLKFCTMMKYRGYVVYHYGHERSEVDCDEHITVTDDKVLQATYGDFDWKKEFFKHNTSDLANTEFVKRCIPEIEKRKQRGDFLLCFWGTGHKPIADAHPDMIVVEPGIGYRSGSSFAKYKVFESYAIAHSQYSELKQLQPPWYHAIIPNYFDTRDFLYNDKKENYFLFLGRITGSKGVDIAVDLTQRIGARLFVAGQGDFKKELSYDPPPHVTLLGFADVDKRKTLLSNAKCLLVPSKYTEPFGGVVIEALLSGTPVITTDWGAFPEINLHGITGYRCRTMDQFIWAALNIDKISPKACREWAENNFSMERVSIMYEEYFRGLLDVKLGKGWYEKHPERTELNWMVNTYPICNKKSMQ